jgi:hypothetical protein
MFYVKWTSRCLKNGGSYLKVSNLDSGVIKIEWHYINKVNSGARRISLQLKCQCSEVEGWYIGVLCVWKLSQKYILGLSLDFWNSTYYYRSSGRFLYLLAWVGVYYSMAGSPGWLIGFCWTQEFIDKTNCTLPVSNHKSEMYAAYARGSAIMSSPHYFYFACIVLTPPGPRYQLYILYMYFVGYPAEWFSTCGRNVSVQINSRKHITKQNYMNIKNK